MAAPWRSMRRSIAACGGGGGGGEEDVVLVRFKVSELTGMEPTTVTSASHPGLFELHPSIASVSIAQFNENGPFKPDDTPMTWRPSLAPSPPHMIPSTITLTITPAGDAVSYSSVTFTISADVPNNPSSIRLKSSSDGFASTLQTYLTDVERTDTVLLTTTESASPFQLVWEAHNDGGANGGGSAGFSTQDLVVLR